MKNAIIIANKRKSTIDSEKPTILHEIIDKTMIEKILDNFEYLNFDTITSLVDYDHDKIKEILEKKSEYKLIDQNTNMLRAVYGIDKLRESDGYTIVTDANVPLITAETYDLMLDMVKEYPMIVLTSYAAGYSGCDIIVRNPEKALRSIIKYEDATADEKAIKEVNMNIYAFNNKLLFEYLDILAKDGSDFDIRDIIKVFKANGHRVMPLQIAEAREAERISSRRDLVFANDWERTRLNNYWQENGVTIYDSATTTIGSDVLIGHDTIIYPNNRIIGKTIIGKNNIIESDNKIKDTKIGDQNIIDRSIINKSEIGSENNIGPWANLREHVIMGDGNRVGSSVELKKTQMKDHNSIAHNVYLGDTTIQSYNNIGWGVVTANYDGKKKNKTKIGSHSFIGSATTIIAPVTIGDKAVVAAGSTINEDVEDNALAIERNHQVNKPNRGKEYLEREE